LANSDAAQVVQDAPYAHAGGTMATTTYLEVAALNIVATPHPEGIYVSLLEAIAGEEFLLGGSDRAKITAPTEFEHPKGFYHGQVFVWAHIDTDQKWLNTEKDVAATDEEMEALEKALPDNLEPNFRYFTYVLDVEEHILLLEVKNENGSRFSPKRAERMFSYLFDAIPEGPGIDITVIPEDETLAKILAIPRLRKLEILVKRPNADDIGDDFNRIMASMQEEGAKSWKIEKVKAAKEKTLKPNEETKKIAAVASTNGHVSGEGTNESGEPVFESTEEHPKIRRIEVVTSSFQAIFSSLRFFRKPVEKPGAGD
jgi:hypothetical protein